MSSSEGCPVAIVHAEHNDRPELSDLFGPVAFGDAMGKAGEQLLWPLSTVFNTAKEVHLGLAEWIGHVHKVVASIAISASCRVFLESSQ